LRRRWVHMYLRSQPGLYGMGAIQGGSDSIKFFYTYP
jgi:hypothetical protein